MQNCPLCGSQVDNLLTHLRDEFERNLREQTEALKLEQQKQEGCG